MKKLCIAAALTLLSACIVPVPIPLPATQNVGSVSDVPVQSTSGFTADLNALRASQGLGPVRQNALLTRAAQLHAQDMVARGYFSHTAVDGPNGRRFSQRAAAAGCAIRAGAENIADGQRSEAAVLQSWANSPGHRTNMLKSNFTEYGLGREGNKWVLLLSSGC